MNLTIPIIEESDSQLHDHAIFEKLWDKMVINYKVNPKQEDDLFWEWTKLISQEINWFKGRKECLECNSSGFYKFGLNYCNACNARGYI
ncbi:MAG: hypothetical protein Q7R95_10575 [bacterium]|nr:hypothetical protein [bacterium]